MDFPEEMIAEFLVRMPLKSVIKSKCVSKDWNKLISGDEFRRWYQYRHHNTRPTGFIYHPERSFLLEYAVEPAKFVCTSNIDKHELNIFNDLHEIGEVVSSSKGLLLLSYKSTSYYVYDLLTKKNIMLPETLKDDDEHVLIGFINKEREQNCLENLIGNGSYLSYKVVFVRTHDIQKPSSKYEVETYSSESGKWHKSMMTAASEFSFDYHDATTIGGVVYCKDYYGETIIVYDPEDPAGCAKLIKTPMVDIPGKLTISGTQDGLLQCIREVSNAINVWVLGTKYEGWSYLDEDIIDRSRWTLVHRIGFMELKQSLLDFRPTGFQDYFYEHVSLNPQDSSVIYLRIYMTDDLLSYNIKEKRVETVLSKGEGEELRAFSYIINFEWPSWPCLH